MFPVTLIIKKSYVIKANCILQQIIFFFQKFLITSGLVLNTRNSNKIKVSSIDILTRSKVYSIGANNKYIVGVTERALFLMK